MSLYNKRMNGQIYKVSSQLSSDELTRDVGVFFKSVLGTLNHILVGDLIWLSRFKEHSGKYQSLRNMNDFPIPKLLNEIICSNFVELSQFRSKLDEIIVNWVSNETIESHFRESLKYADTKGKVSTRNFGELVSHLFNHQTHHRGQVCALLNQFGKEAGVTDYLVDIPSV